MRGQFKSDLTPYALRGTGDEDDGSGLHASYTMPRMPSPGPASLSASLHARLQAALAQGDGWLPFDRYMAIALYEPGLGYYSRGSGQIGPWPGSGSDFVTAPEMSPLFGAALARQVRQALDAAEADEVFEFGAGTGALAAQLLGSLGTRVRRYNIVDLSGSLRARQTQRLAPFGEQVRWLDTWPAALHGLVLGNEVLDAMPVQLLHWDGQAWWERGVSLVAGQLAWADRPTPLRPPVEAGFVPGTVVEIHPQAQAFITTLGERLTRGMALFIDYGFPEAEYYHPQRTGGTLMCHHAHLSDPDPLDRPGEKDITAHVDFTGIALAAQSAGLDVIGYTSQARLLINCGLLDLLQGADPRTTSAAHRLIAEHEMGELFKAIALSRGVDLQPLGFAAGDRTHRL
jgi:SAM-dependent MidA family methyltransferase